MNMIDDAIIHLPGECALVIVIKATSAASATGRLRLLVLSPCMEILSCMYCHMSSILISLRYTALRGLGLL